MSSKPQPGGAQAPMPGPSQPAPEVPRPGTAPEAPPPPEPPPPEAPPRQDPEPRPVPPTADKHFPENRYGKADRQSSPEGG